MLKYTLSILFVIVSVLVIHAQEMDVYLVNIRGKVVDIETGNSIPYAHVINPSQHSGTTTNADGDFSINMLTEDTLLIKAIGYGDYRFHPEEFPPLNHYELRIKPIRFSVGEVTVEAENGLKKSLGLPDAKPLDIPVELRGNAFNEKPPWYAAFVSPISFAQYFLSSKEKGKRELYSAIKEGEQWSQYAVNFNLPKIKKLTGLDGTDADEFMIYCNMNNRLPYDATPMQIDFQIMDLFFKYKKMKLEQKSDSISVD